MSFLTDRLYSLIDNSTRDPAAEAIQKRDQEAIYLMTTQYKKELISAKEALITKPPKTYSDFDKPLLSKLNEERTTLLDNPTGLTADLFKRKWTELSEKYNIVANPKSPARYEIYKNILIIKQGVNDSKPTGDTRTFLTNIQKEIIDFLNTNIYTDSAVIFDKYAETIRSKIAGNSEANKIITEAYSKINKNQDRLDFQEEGGSPVPADVLANKAQQEALEKEKQQDTFDIGRLLGEILRIAVRVFFSLLFIFLILMGASFAVNLNIYKPYPFRILYALYGALFAIVVVPYTLLYRWVYLGKKPKYYGFLPMIPRFFVHRPVQFLLGWLTYKPDEQMWELEEWRKKGVN